MDCHENADPLKLIREGTSQRQRTLPALEPAYAPVNERSPAHSLVFAQAYAPYLRYYNSQDVALGDWQRFFAADVSAQLAVAAVQDVSQYKTVVQETFTFLSNRDQDDADLKQHLGYLFSIAATMARALDVLRNTLPEEIALRGALQNLITSQLAAGLERLIAYYKADLLLPEAGRLVAAGPPDLVLLGSPALDFSLVYREGLSGDWITNGASDWQAYTAAILPDASVYGSGGSVFDQIDHLATHNLFTSVFDQFLKVFARVVVDARAALDDTFTKWDRHEPHYALFLAFLRLQEYSRQEMNTLTRRHLNFYYRDILRLREKPAEPGHAHLLVELARHAGSHLLQAGELFKAGKDDLGRDVFFANDRDFVANQAQVAAVKTLYRHQNEPNETLPFHQHRVFASPLANSDDGLHPGLTSVDQSWHPFFNKIYTDGLLTEVRMPQAELGFGIASHYLWLAEGTRTITLDFSTQGTFSGLAADRKTDIECLLTTEKGWLTKTATRFITEAGVLRLVIDLAGADPALTAYAVKTHGYTFATTLPVLLVKLRHQQAADYLYPFLQAAVLQKIVLTVQVSGLKTLAVSNDFGPVDTAKPFQPYGPSPVAGNALIIGSKEIFQKKLTAAAAKVTWLIAPVPYKTSPQVRTDFLQDGQWKPSGIAPVGVATTQYNFTAGLDLPVVEEPDASPNAFYGTSSRHGFLRLSVDADFGQLTYQKELRDFLIDKAKIFPPATPAAEPATMPVFPVMAEISLSYTASQDLDLSSSNEAEYLKRKALFFHLTPFGQAEQHPYLKTQTGAPDAAIYLVAQLKHRNRADKALPADHPVHHEAECYIGITGLVPPQSLSLLFQVADGTADPLAHKPEPHIHWSYLRDNEWLEFPSDAVADQTDELLNSGIVTLAMPREATAANTLLPGGMHWIRLAVAEASEAVARLMGVAAQALGATFTDQANDPAFPAKVLRAGTVSKLDQADAAVKKVTQPFPSFGGRGQEASSAFYTRVSERLRHKDRAIALWDYERLVLEAFPQIYKVKCLNHTHYEPKSGVYKELAPGHVTVVTIPDQQSRNLRNPLRPYTSLGLLRQIGDFLKKRLSCFVKLHVENPQFEDVSVSFQVKLYEGFDETFYLLRLQEAITRFLSPWAFPGGGSPSFGGIIYKSVLINFVEEQDYVDYVTDFQLFHSITGTTDRAEVAGSKAVSILVSVPAQDHIITAILASEEETPRESCPCEA